MMSEENKQRLLNLPAPRNLEEWCFQCIAASFDHDATYEELRGAMDGAKAYIGWLASLPVVA
jgi:hypothetical protein